MMKWTLIVVYLLAGEEVNQAVPAFDFHECEMIAATEYLTGDYDLIRVLCVDHDGAVVDLFPGG